jgi:5'-methylthioadenosine phosphorylase
MASSEIAVGIVGGSGFYELLDDAREVTPETPYGPTSAPVVIGEIAGRCRSWGPPTSSCRAPPAHCSPT